MLKITVCPSCGSEKIKKVRRDWTGTYHDRSYVVPKLAFYECPRCGEKVYDREAMRRIERGRRHSEMGLRADPP